MLKHQRVGDFFEENYSEEETKNQEIVKEKNKKK